MKILNINTKDEYPDNYDNLSDELKDDILSYMNNQQEVADRYYDKHITDDEDTKEQYLDLYNHQLDLLCGSKNGFYIMGVRVEYNWPREPGKWILATKEDWQQREDSKSCCACTESKKTETFQGWPRPRGTRNEKYTIPFVH